MDERVAKLNAELKKYQERMADLRHRQVVAVEAFSRRAVERKIADIRKTIFRYGSQPGERAGRN